jgi:hypothetical protein
MGKEPKVNMAIRRREDLTERDLGSEMILYDPRSETFHILNDTARSIWLMLDGELEEAQLQDAFADLYPREDRSLLGGDLRRTIEEFNRKGLIES